MAGGHRGGDTEAQSREAECPHGRPRCLGLLCLATAVGCDHTLSSVGPPPSVLVKLIPGPPLCLVLLVSASSLAGRGGALGFQGRAHSPLNPPPLYPLPHAETSAEPSLQAKQLKLKRARLADDLNEKIAQRPGPMELVEKNILPVESSLKEAIIGEELGLPAWTRKLAQGEGRRAACSLTSCLAWVEEPRRGEPEPEKWVVRAWVGARGPTDQRRARTAQPVPEASVRSPSLNPGVAPLSQRRWVGVRVGVSEHVETPRARNRTCCSFSFVKSPLGA